MKRVLLHILNVIALVALSYGLWMLCADLYQRNNRFPVRYHPDEAGKAGQILRDERNFNHPQLMLEATQWLIARQHTPMEPDEIVFTGRTASAYMAASAALLLAWAGYFAARWPGFLLVGAGAGLCPALLAHAHYMKEEAALCFGIAAVVCVAAAMCRHFHWVIVPFLSALLGASVGLAASGKYVGAVMAAPALVVLILGNVRRWWLILPCLIVASTCAYYTWTNINWRAMENWAEFREGFDREHEHATTEHRGVMLPAPTPYFANLLWTEAMPHVKALAVLAPFALLLMRRRLTWRVIPLVGSIGRGAGDAMATYHIRTLGPPREPPMLFGWWLMLTIAAFTIITSYSVIPFYRYIMPATMLLYALAGLGAAWGAEWFSTRYVPRWALVLAGFAAIAIPQWYRCQDYTNQFANDSRDALREWVRKEVPRNTLIAAEDYTHLDGWRTLNKEFRTPARVNRVMWTADLGTINELRHEGYRYVVVASTCYERFFEPYVLASPHNEFEFKHRQKFYRELFDRYPIAAQWRAEHNMRTFANPDITVFRIDQGPRKD